MPAEEQEQRRGEEHHLRENLGAGERAEAHLAPQPRVGNHRGALEHERNA